MQIEWHCWRTSYEETYTKSTVKSKNIPACISLNGRRKITQNSIEVDAETKESTRKIEEKLDGKYKEGHERKKPMKAIGKMGSSGV